MTVTLVSSCPDMAMNVRVYAVAAVVALHEQRRPPDVDGPDKPGHDDMSI